MKNISRLLVSIIFVSLLFVPNIVNALAADTPGGSTIEQRIKQRITEQKVNLTAKDITRYKSRCVNAQSAFREIQSKFGPIRDKRLDVYGKVDAKLWIVIGQLKLADKDTYNLEVQRAEYAKKVEVYSNTLNQYRQTVDDIVVMNCEADLTGFIALVNTAKEYHQSIRQQSEDINTFVVNNIKSTLGNFVTELQPKPSTEQ